MVSIEFQSGIANPHIDGVIDVDPQELNSLRSQVRIIDVREIHEFTGELGHIPEAELIVLNTLPGRIDELAKDEIIVFVCRSGARSAQASSFFHQNGFQRTYNLKGGMILWNQLGLPIE